MSGCGSYAQNGETEKLKRTGVGHPGLGPDFRDLMSRTARENALQEPDVRGTGRMSGGPDVRGGRCPGLRAGCPGSKSEDELEELDFWGGKLRFRGQNWGDFVDERWGNLGRC